MKKNLMLLFAAAVMLNSCGTAAHLASSDQEHKFQDGIYSSSPDRITRSEKVTSKAKTDSLAAMTRLIIPDNTQPVTVEKIKPLQKSDATTIIVVNDNPWDWRNNIDVWYSYNPYSVWNYRYSSSWYWNSWLDHHGTTGGTTHGITDGMIHGIMAGQTLGTTDGTTHGTTVGQIHGTTDGMTHGTADGVTHGTTIIGDIITHIGARITDLYITTSQDSDLDMDMKSLRTYG